MSFIDGSKEVVFQLLLLLDPCQWVGSSYLCSNLVCSESSSFTEQLFLLSFLSVTSFITSSALSLVLGRHQ